MLKKISIILSLFYVNIYSFPVSKKQPKAQNNHLPMQIQVAFTAANNNEIQIKNEDLIPAIKTLQEISNISTQRALTLEEIFMAYKIILFLYLSETPYQKQVVISLNNNNQKIILPFSSQILLELLAQEEKLNDNLNA